MRTLYGTMSDDMLNERFKSGNFTSEAATRPTYYTPSPRIPVVVMELDPGTPEWPRVGDFVVVKHRHHMDKCKVLTPPVRGGSEQEWRVVLSTTGGRTVMYPIGDLDHWREPHQTRIIEFPAAMEGAVKSALKALSVRTW